MKRIKRIFPALILLLLSVSALIVVAACNKYNPKTDIPGIKSNAVMQVEHNYLYFAKDMQLDTADIIEKSNCVLVDDEGNEAKVTAAHVRDGIVECGQFDTSTVGTEKQLRIAYKQAESFIIYNVTDYKISFYLNEEQTDLWKTVPASASLSDDLQLSVWVDVSDYNYSTDITVREKDGARAAKFNGWYDSATNPVTGAHSLTALTAGETRTLNLHAHFLTDAEAADFNIVYDGRNRRVFRGYTGAETELVKIPEGVTYIDIVPVFLSSPLPFKQLNIPSTATMELPLTGFVNTVGLEKITVNDGSRYYADYEGALYSKDYKTLYLMPASCQSDLFHDDVTVFERYSCAYWLAKSVVIPDTVKELGTYCFAYSNLVQAIGIERSDLNIGTCAFWGSQILKEEFNDAHYVVLGNGKYSLSRVSKDVTEFTLLEGTTSISADAFNGCTKLTSIDLSGSKIESIGSSAFSGCTSLESVKLPSSLKYMGSSVFYGCTGLKEVTGLTSVTYLSDTKEHTDTLPDGTFNRCESLEKIELPAGLVAIGTDAFYNCASLKNITFPEGLEEIGESAFYSCGFESINLPKSLVKLGEKAFFGSELKSIDLSKCESLTELPVRCFQETNLTEVTIPDRITKIPNYCFYLNRELKKVTLSRVTELGQYCFGYCEKLESFDFGTALQKIDSRAFTNCQKLDNVVLPDTVHTVVGYAFQNCDGLQYLTLGKGVKAFGSYTMMADDKNAFNSTVLALWQCDNIKYISVSEENENFASVDGVLYGKSAASFNFESKTAILYAVPSAYSDKDGNVKTTLTLPDDVKIILPYSVETQKSIKEFNLNEGLENIGKAAFYMSESIEVLNIPASVTTIGANILLDSKGLQTFTISAGNEKYLLEDSEIYEGKTLLLSVGLNADVVIKDGTEVIATGAFMHNNVIETVTIPDSVTTVSANAFNGCSKLTEIVIGKGVNSIGANALASLPSLKTIRVDSDNKSFKAVNNILYSFDGKKLILCAAQNGITTLDGISGVTEIGSYAFAYHATLTSVRLPVGVKTIGDYSFYDCRRVTEFYASEALENIGSRAFAFASTINPSDSTDTRACDVLKTVMLYGELKTIGDHAFYGQYGLADVYLHMTEAEYDAIYEANKGKLNLSYLFYGCPVLNQTGKYYNNGGKGVSRYLYMATETDLPAPNGFAWFYVENGKPKPRITNTSED